MKVELVPNVSLGADGTIVETLTLEVELEDAELDTVFKDTKNSPLFSSLYSPTVEALAGSQKVALVSQLLALVEAPQATNLGLKSEPEQPA